MKGTNLLLFTTIAMAASAQFLMKLGSKKLGVAPFDLGAIQFVIRVLSTPAILAGFCIYGVSAFLWVVVLSKLDLSFAYPMVAAGYIFVALLSWGIFHERMTVMRGMALLIIAAGVVVLGLSQSK